MSSGVTFKVAGHPAAKVNSPSSSPSSSQLHYLAERYRFPEYEQQKCGRILQGTPWKRADFRPSDNGFVQGVVNAYNKHHNLVIRPDDVWLAIVIQFGNHVNNNAEAMRSVFVEHTGKKELIVYSVATLETADYGRLAQNMTAELKANLKDPSICDWALPRFSTTTHNDTIVGSVALMATMKEYFSYTAQLDCGIPRVTLAGTVEDWEEIHCRVEKLQSYGEICSKWACMLKKITHQLIQTSRGVIDLTFWAQICHYISHGSGPTFLSGWISAFCVFGRQGKWQANNFNASGRGPTLEFPVIDTSDIPPGYLTVDLTVDDNGTEFKTLMFSGHMGYDVVHAGKGIAPKLAWAIALKGGKFT